MSRHTTPSTVTLCVDGYECERPVTLHYEYTRAERGARERGTGLQMEPDYPSGVSLEAVETAVGERKVDLLPLLSPKCVESLEGYLVQSHEEGVQSDRDDARWNQRCDSFATVEYDDPVERFRNSEGML